MAWVILFYRKILMSETKKITSKFHLRNEIFPTIERNAYIVGFCKIRFLTFHCFLTYKFHLRKPNPEISGLVSITT